MDWSSVLDFKRALANVRRDILGDWYRDPWGWPELAFAVESAPELLVSRLNAKGCHRALTIDVIKENFVIRPAVVLDPLDRLCYQALVDTVSKSLIGSLPGWAYGWRLPRKEPEPGNYMSNSKEWEFYRNRLRYLATASSYGLTSDIVSFFASVSIPLLMEDVQTVAGRNGVVARLEDFLLGVQTIPGRPGLPQRCWASSVLAQFFLGAIDVFLDRKASDSGLFAARSPLVVRWMDDIWVFGESAMDLRMVQLELQDVLARRSLRMNAGKTTVLEGDDLTREAMEIEHSAVDSALDDLVRDPKPLEEMIEGLLERPSLASRTSLRFATSRMRIHKKFGKVGQFVDAAMNLPQACDHLARLFRESGDWAALAGWYVEKAKTVGSKLTWPMYHLGTMFPTTEAGPPDLVQFWAEGLASGRLPILQVPLAAQRLAAWNPEVARQSIQAASRNSSYDHPFAMRALAFAGRAVDLPATEGKQLLRQFGELDVSLQMLAEQGMRPPRPAPDFAAP